MKNLFVAGAAGAALSFAALAADAPAAKKATAKAEPVFISAAEAKGETVPQLHGIGPFDIHYLNPADDPTPKVEAVK
jgi:hypothetical protein